jgi:hypothetical protein
MDYSLSNYSPGRTEVNQEEASNKATSILSEFKPGALRTQATSASAFLCIYLHMFVYLNLFAFMNENLESL